MPPTTITATDRTLAKISEHCLVCRRARQTQRGLAFWIVKTFENACPFCRAYERVQGRKSHEPAPLSRRPP
jgi:hypothetical protein